MSSVLLMEWNGKLPFQWCRENLVMVNAPNKNPEKLQALDWEMEGEKGLDSGSFNSSGIGSGSRSGGSGSDLGLVSLSKSSKSPSINSSSIGEVIAPNFSLRASNSVSGELGKVKPDGTSAAPEASICSSEPLLSLKLGKRAYFEDVYAGTTMKTSSISSTLPPSVTPLKRSRSSAHAVSASLCQVEGCDLDLSSAKDYHRKHRVCEEHSKSPKVMVNGLERRFCQQCSRFHGLSEFDEKKRSCRRRLSDHNARRRKPQTDLNSARLPSTPYGERQGMSFVWNRSPVVHAGSSSNLTWESASSPRFTITQEYVSKPAKMGNISGQQHIIGNGLISSIPMHHGSSNGVFPSKGKVVAEATNQGLRETIISSNVDATQDLHRALSLLSTNTWRSCDTNPLSLDQPLHKNPTSIPPSVPPSLPQAWPGPSSELWRTEQLPADSHLTDATPQSNGSSYYQEFQLLRGPYETDFYSHHLN